MNRRVRALGFAALLLIWCAAPAQATVTVTSFSVDPAPAGPGGEQAGVNPDITISSGFSSPDSDDVKDVILSLAPGLLANPLVSTNCTSAQLSSMPTHTCPASSKVGQGTVTIVPVGIRPAEIFDMQPQGSEPARLGLRIDAPGNVPDLFKEAPISVRTTPGDVGLDATFSNLDRTAAGGQVQIQITDITLTLNGVVNAHPFTRMPTYCDAPANSRVTAVPYDSGAADTEDSAFTATGCNLLAFDPGLEASGSRQADGSFPLRTLVTQEPTESPAEQVTLTLPHQLIPRGSRIQGACDANDFPNPRDCPAATTVGSVSATIPVLTAPLTGRVVIRTGFTPNPDLWLLFNDPIPLSLRGTVTQPAGLLRTTFSGIPDVPITELVVQFNGGPNSLLLAASDICDPGPAVDGNLLAHRGPPAAFRRATIQRAGACVRGPAVGRPGGSGGTPLVAGDCANAKTGTGGADNLFGTHLGDRLRGRGGNDRIVGLAGVDCLFGEAGRDRLSGGSGNDRLSGGSGRDRLASGPGADRLTGGAGRDRLSGNSGADRLNAGSGNDNLRGGSGRDKLRAGSGRDRLNGGGGRDRFSGGSGDDRINSLDDVRETVRCGPGTDKVKADRNDRLIGCESVRRLL